MSHEQRIEALRARLAGVESVDISTLHVAPKGDSYVAEPQVDIPADHVTPSRQMGHPRPDLPGVSTEFAARLSDEDWEDIAAGDSSEELVQAFEAAAIGREAPATAATPATPAGLTLVRCTDCTSFVPDAIGDGHGIGRCAVDGEGSRPRGRWETRPALWARAERRCGDWAAIELEMSPVGHEVQEVGV
jgi:hypothetical protein